MLNYITYQCSICRRTKDVLRDNLRATPVQCIITKGCEGRLFKIGEKAVADITTPESGITDWYPRGGRNIAKPVTVDEETVSLLSSETGLLTLAIYQSDATAAANELIQVKLIQRRVEDISYIQYVFKPVSNTLSIAGRDSGSKNLRFDALAIQENRVFVRVDGVARFTGPDANDIVLSPDTVTFNSVIFAGAIVEISVYQDTNTVERNLIFTLNSNNAFVSSGGSWSNVRWVKEYDVSTKQSKPLKWWLYTCTSLGGISNSARLKLDGIYKGTSSEKLIQTGDLSNAMFLLSSSPYENTDRYLNFSANLSQMYNEYALSTVASSVVELHINFDMLTEHYPPLQLIKSVPALQSSFVTPDTFTTNISIPVDTQSVKLKGKKVLGPT